MEAVTAAGISAVAALAVVTLRLRNYWSQAAIGYALSAKVGKMGKCFQAVLTKARRNAATFYQQPAAHNACCNLIAVSSSSQ